MREEKNKKGGRKEERERRNEGSRRYDKLIDF